MKDYTILRSKRKTVALIVNSEGALIIKAPLKASIADIEKIVSIKKNWIDQKQRIIRHKNEIYKVHKFEAGEEFLFLGKKYPLIFSDVKGIKLKNDFLYINKLNTDKKNAIIKWYKKAAKIILTEQISKYEKITGLKTIKIKISSAKRRWGSCGRDGNINFSFRLIMCPIEIIDYVVLHEMVHIIYPNHSKDFYNCLRLFMPEYKAYKNWLADNQRIMDII